MGTVATEYRKSVTPKCLGMLGMKDNKVVPLCSDENVNICFAIYYNDRYLIIDPIHRSCWDFADTCYVATYLDEDDIHIIENVINEWLENL